MTDLSPLVHAIDAAEQRIRPYLIETPLLPSPLLEESTGAQVALKCENLQHTGSFKVRGALNKVLSLDEASRAQGVVAASTGNHGAAVAHAIRLCDSTATVFVPHQACAQKVERMAALGAKVIRHGDDCVESEAEARRFAEQKKRTFVSPYNDPDVVAGQGTVAIELLRQCPDLDTVVVGTGGGGLVSGIGVGLKARRPSVKVIACSPSNSAVLAHSLEAGELLDLPSLPTLSDGTAGGVEAGSITFGLARQVIDEFLLVPEEEIRTAFRDVLHHHHLVIEGAAAMAVAACRRADLSSSTGTVAVVLCGANASAEVLVDILSDEPGAES